jgi:hypothetical protein
MRRKRGEETGLVRQIKELEQDNARLRDAVEWALATGGPADVGNLADWEDELRRKAGMEGMMRGNTVL